MVKKRRLENTKFRYSARDDGRESKSFSFHIGERAHLYGKASVSVEHGVFNISGYQLHGGRPALVVQADHVGSPIELRAMPHQVVVPCLDQRPATICVRKPADHGALSPPDGIDQQLPEEFTICRESEGLIATTPEAWTAAADAIAASAAGTGHPQVVVAVCGSKGVGKSSFLQLLTNTLLNQHPRVAYLDADCGQPEFTPPGAPHRCSARLVSAVLVDAPVFGPPHLHQHEPAHAHFIGDISSQSDPQAYVAAVASLCRWVKSEHAMFPVVVNTPGWIQGLGYDILREVLLAAAPTHVLLLSTPTPRRNLPALAFWLPEDLQRLEAAGIELHASTAGFIMSAGVHLAELPAVGQDSVSQAEQHESAVASIPAEGSPAAGRKGAVGLARLPPSERRALSWLAFAQRIVGLPVGAASGTAAFVQAALGLMQEPPAVCSWDELRTEVLFVSGQPAMLGHVLNGAVVGLLKNSKRAQHDSLMLPPSLVQGTDLLQHQQLPHRCLGLGIVRAVDLEHAALYLLTDLPLARLQAVDTLQVGKLELPSALLQGGERMSPYISTWSISAEGTGAGPSKSRNNLLRAGQL